MLTGLMNEVFGSRSEQIQHIFGCKFVDIMNIYKMLSLKKGGLLLLIFLMWWTFAECMKKKDLWLLMRLKNGSFWGHIPVLTENLSVIPSGFLAAGCKPQLKKWQCISVC